jgi:hypothetical protein
MIPLREAAGAGHLRGGSRKESSVEVIVAVAIGLNPYAGAFVAAALSSFSGRVPLGDFGLLLPHTVVTSAAILLGLAMPIDFVLAKFVRFAPRVRRTSQFVAPVTGAFITASMSRSGLPLPLVAAGAAVVSWAIAAMLTSTAARASRSPSWIGLGHIPVLMSAATAAACMVPLGVAKPALGLGLAVVAVATLLWMTATAPRAAAAARPAGAARTV